MRPAEHEVERILALVPWIVANPGRTVDEIAARFGVSPEQLAADLDLVLMIGVPPYSPGDYLEVDVDDEQRVTIRLADYFRRPLRLTPLEGLALLAAGRALLAVPGSDTEGPLAAALDKLERTLALPGVHVEVGEPVFLEQLRAAADRHERVEIDYWSAGRDELTTRRIDPQPPFYALGAWYVAAYCHRAGADRMFRADRVRGVRPTGEHFEAPGDAEGFEPPDAVYHPRRDDPRVTLVLPASAEWVLERFPAESVVPRRGGRLEVVLAVSETAWLERLLLRLGPDAAVKRPPEWRDAASRAATRVLARYSPASRPGDVSPDVRG